MKRFASFIFVAVLFAIVADTATAQIGRGRLLKKLRDDLFGQEQQMSREQAARKAEENRKRVEAQRKAQLEARQRAGNAQTPTPNRTNQQAPNRNTQLTPNRNQPTGAANQQTRIPTNVRQRQPNVAATPKTPQRKGFGFELTEKDDRLFVSKIASNGNAAEAGIRRGDEIVGIGGVDVKTQDGFDDIAEILSEGDNIEIGFKRKGRVDEVQVGFGMIPDVDDPSLEIPSGVETTNNNRHGLAPPREQPDVGSRNQDMARMERVIRDQQRVIEELQAQLRRVNASSNPESSRQPASVLQNGPAFNGPGGR